MKYLQTLIPAILIASLGYTNSLFAQPGNIFKSDSTIIKEILPNGFTYYIKHLPDAGEDIYMRFYLKAGSRVETINQPEVSHAIEHLAFRETRNFPLGISNYTALLQEVGMKGLGRDIYAFNGHLGTQYIFNAKTTYPKSIDLGLLWFQDIMDGLSLTNEAIDMERKTLIQEREGKYNMQIKNKIITDSQLFTQIFPCQQNQEGYKEKVTNFSSDSLRSYYEDWYQPKNAGIVVVGNIPNIKRLNDEMKIKFSGFKNEESARDVPNCDLDYFKRPNQFIIVERNSDKISQFLDRKMEVNLFYRDSFIRKGNNIEGLKRQFLWDQTNEVLRNHLQQLTQSYSNNFNVEVLNYFKQRKLPVANSIKIKAEGKYLISAIEEVILKINEIRTFGITPEEWDDLKNKQIHYFEQIINEYPKNPQFWTGEIERNFQFNEPLVNQKYNFLMDWIMQLEVEDYNKILKEFLSQAPQDIGIVIPENEKFKYNELKLRSLIKKKLHKRVFKKKQDFPKEILSKEKFQNLKPSAISLIEKKMHGVQEFKLENGIRLVLLKDDTPGENIKFWGFSSKGSSILPQELINSAGKSSNIIMHSGIGKYNKFEIDSFLESIDPNIQVRPYINFNESGIKAQSKAQNIETLLKLVFLYFTEPRKDKEAFQHWKKQELQNFLIPSYSIPQADFENNVRMFFGKSRADFLSGSFHYDGTQAVNLNGAYLAYQTIFSDFSDFTFIITGNFNEEILLPQVRKYLGNLPSAQQRVSKYEPEKINKKIPKGPVKQKLNPSKYYPMENVIYSLRYVEKTDGYDWKKHLKVQLVSELIWEMAIKLRTEEGFALYDISNNGSYIKDLSMFEVSLKLSCLPEEVDKIKFASINIFKKIQEGNIDPILFEKALNRVTGYYSTNGKYDIESELYNQYRFGNNWVDLEKKENFLKKFTYEDMQIFVKCFLSQKNQYEFVM